MLVGHVYIFFGEMPIFVLCDFLISSFNSSWVSIATWPWNALCVLPGAIAPGGSFTSLVVRETKKTSHSFHLGSPGPHPPLRLDSVHFPWAKAEVFLVLFNVLCPSVSMAPLLSLSLPSPIVGVDCILMAFEEALLHKVLPLHPWANRWANPWAKNSGALKAVSSAHQWD